MKDLFRERPDLVIVEADRGRSTGQVRLTNLGYFAADLETLQIQMKTFVLARACPSIVLIPRQERPSGEMKVAMKGETTDVVIGGVTKDAMIRETGITSENAVGIEIVGNVTGRPISTMEIKTILAEIAT